MEVEKLAPLLESVRVATLQPQDILVVKTSSPTDLLQRAELHQYIEEATGHPRILVVDPTVEIAVVRPQQETASDIARAVLEVLLPVFEEQQAPADSRPKAGKAPGAIA